MGKYNDIMEDLDKIGIFISETSDVVTEMLNYLNDAHRSIELVKIDDPHLYRVWHRLEEFQEEMFPNG